MYNFSPDELRTFVDPVRSYFRKSTDIEPRITAAFLSTEQVEGFEFNGIVTFSGSHCGRIIVSLPGKMLQELLMMQQEGDTGEENMLDTAGEIANTLIGNARRTLGSQLQISVPMKLQGKIDTRTKTRRPQYVIMLSWREQAALICIDVEKNAGFCAAEL